MKEPSLDLSTWKTCVNPRKKVAALESCSIQQISWLRVSAKCKPTSSDPDRSQVSGEIATIFVYWLLASTWTHGVLNQQNSSLCTVNNLKHFNLSFSRYCEEWTSWSSVCKPTSSDPALLTFGKCFWSNCNYFVLSKSI